MPYQVPDRQKQSRIPSGHQSGFGTEGQSDGCIRSRLRWTKSDAECQKEDPMTRKLLITAAIVAIALAPSIGIGTAQACGFGGDFGGFHGGEFGGGGFHGG